MKPIHALVVDDDDSIRWMLRTILAEMGYSVAEAENVQDALELFQNAEVVFRLIVTDLEMPGATGITLIREVIATPKQEPPKKSVESLDFERRADTVYAALS